MSQRKVGVLLSYASEAVQILTALVYTPIMLRLLGQSEYGLYQLVYSIVAYMSLFSLGFGSSYMRFYSRFKAKNDEKEIARLNGMFMTIFLVISGICIICGIVLILNIEAVMGDGLTAAELSKSKILMALMVFNMAISFPASVFNCNTTAHEQFIFQKGLLIAQKILNPFLALPLLLLGYGSVGMVVITTVLTVAAFGCNAVFCLKKLKIKFIFKGFKLSLLKEMWGFTFFIFLNQIIDQINWNLDKFLLGRMVGTTGVAVYGLGAHINTLYLQFSTSISNVFVPKVNKIVAESDDDNLLSELFTKIGRIQFLVLGLILSGFIFFGQPFMHFWGGAGYEKSYNIALWLTVPATVPLIQNLGLEIQRAKNKHKARSVVYFCVVIANIGLSIQLIKKFGVSGAAIGTAISITLGTILFMNWYYHNKLGINIIYFWKNIAKFIPALSVCAIVGILINEFVPLYSLVNLGISICVYALVYIIAMWKLGMNKEEKDMILGMFRRKKSK